jgi:hypothetical protein
MMRSGDAFPNFAAVWLSCLLIFWNVYRAMPEPVYQFGFLKLMLYGAVLPIGIFALLLAWVSRGDTEAEPLDMADEWGDTA